MGTLRGDNGGERPPEGGGLPDLPAEWGTVIIPDDPAELDQEMFAVRRELRGQLRRARWRRRFGLPTWPTRQRAEDAAALGVPLLIMSIAIIATLASLFAVAWPRQHQPVPPVGASSRISAADLTLAEPGGGTVQLADTLPAVILLVDGCDCANLLNQTVAAAPPGVTVLAVTRAAPPAGSTAPPPVRSLIDGSGALRAALGAAPATADGSAAALLVKADGTVVRAVPATRGVDDFRTELTELPR